MTAIARAFAAVFALLAGCHLTFAAVDLGTEWAYQPPNQPRIPEVKNTAWPRSPIDHFILARLEAKNLPPAKPAAKATLIRRVTFDLIGLPPTPEEVEAFLNDTSTNAWEKVVERLLSSPHYGERWARHWLDVVRYTDSFDSRGIGGEGDVPEAYRYRDWVVNAFNRDLPYDQFVIQQIAGDILATNSPGGFDPQKLIATGVYVIGEWGTGDADKEKMLTDIVDDQIDVTGRAFLGLTLACARCHDHKFDPISTEDYYALAGIFFSSHILPSPGVKTAGSPVLRIPLLSPDEIAARKKRDERKAELEKQIAQRTDESISQLAKSLLPQLTNYLDAAVDPQRAVSKLLPEVVAGWRGYLGEPDLPLLSKVSRNIQGKENLHALQNPAGKDTPSATINLRDEETQFITITMPARSVAVHPSPSAGVAVEWRSPISGHVQITGRVADADNKCGNGIVWELAHRGAGGSPARLLTSGEIANGGMKTLASSSTVTNGDLIRLTILPNKEYSCDTTVIDLQIGEWNLTSNVLAGFRVNPNPIPDHLGHTNVWRFVDAAGLKQKDIAPNSPLARWIAEKSPTAAAQLQGSLATGTNFFVDPKSDFWKPIRDSEALMTAELRALKQELQSINSQPTPSPAMAHTLQEGGTPKSAHEGIHDVRVHMRGRYDRLGDTVPRSFPKILAHDKQPGAFSGSGRLELAQWIASAENPLTARVMVNRIWQHHFGEGIVRTPNNYGKLGTPPTHPELLDHLALQFINSGWSIKAMHRAILLSAAYQQSSVPDPQTLQADPENLLFGHMNRRRLEAEAIRDSLLHVANRLDHRTGGPASRELDNPRRTLYLMTIRSERATYQSLFDAADPNSIVEKRNISTVAPQALFLMNHPFVLKHAQLLAQRVEAEAPDLPAKINRIYRLLYSRPPTEKESAMARSAAADWQSYCHTLLCANEFLYVD